MTKILFFKAAKPGNPFAKKADPKDDETAAVAGDDAAPDAKAPPADDPGAMPAGDDGDDALPADGEAGNDAPAGDDSTVDPSDDADPDGADTAPGEYSEANIAVGDHVAFEAGAFKSSGEVTATGEDGCTVSDETGREHRVHWEEITGNSAAGAGDEAPPADGAVPAAAPPAGAVPPPVGAAGAAAAPASGPAGKPPSPGTDATGTAKVAAAQEPESDPPIDDRMRARQ